MMKKRLTGLCIAFTYAAIMLLAPSGAMARGQDRHLKTDTQKYTLYPAPSKNDPYSVQYPITLKEAGLITVKVHVGGGKLKGKHPLRLWIVDAAGVHNEKSRKIERKYIKREIHFKDKDTSVSYPVDSGELARTKGKYVIFLSNENTGSHCVGTITITYPGGKASTASKRQSSEERVRHKRD